VQYLNDKNLLLGELNMRKTELNINGYKPQDKGTFLGDVAPNEYQIKSSIIVETCQSTTSLEEEVTCG
jgi:hypothetical protein